MSRQHKSTGSLAPLLSAGLLTGLTAFAHGGNRTTSAHADQVPIEALVWAIAAWTAERLDLPVPDRLPGIVFDEPMEMPRLMRVGIAVSTPVAEPEIIAFYDAAEAVIHLPIEWTGVTPGDLSVLVHEMTHHLQALSGEQFDCPAAAEKAAFGAQEDWLALFGTDLEREFQLDRMFLLVSTNCGMP